MAKKILSCNIFPTKQVVLTTSSSYMISATGLTLFVLGVVMGSWACFMINSQWISYQLTLYFSPHIQAVTIEGYNSFPVKMNWSQPYLLE